MNMVNGWPSRDIIVHNGWKVVSEENGCIPRFCHRQKEASGEVFRRFLVLFRLSQNDSFFTSSKTFLSAN